MVGFYRAISYVAKPTIKATTHLAGWNNAFPFLVDLALYFVWKSPLFTPYFGQKCPLFCPLFLHPGPLLKCGQYDKLHSQIRTPWNSNNDWHGLQNNHACKWIPDNFPQMLTYVSFLENCLKSICMPGCSPIHMERYFFFLKLLNRFVP